MSLTIKKRSAQGSMVPPPLGQERHLASSKQSFFGLESFFVVVESAQLARQLHQERTQMEVQ